MYYSWPDILPASIEVRPVQFPGRGSRVSEKPISDLMELVSLTEAALISGFDKPFAFFGHSMGALLSYELTRRLISNHNIIPELLFVSGHNAPQIPDTTEPIYDLPDEKFVERLRMLNGTPDEVLQDPELKALLLPILRADFAASETYVFEEGVPITCPICACGGLGDKFVSREGLNAWRENTKSTFSMRLFPGDHFYLNHEKMLLLQAIAQEINKIIDLRN